MGSGFARAFKAMAVLTVIIGLLASLLSLVAWREGLGCRYALFALLWLAVALWGFREFAWALRRL